jgi:hypothetical protein
LTTPDGEKVTFSEDGGEVNITVKGEDGAEVKISGDDSGVSLPDGFPSDVPVYPGATVALSSKTPEGVHVLLQTKDGVQDVRRFYQEKLKAAGWKIATTVNVPGGIMLQANKGKRVQNVTTMNDGRLTTINLTTTTEGG